MSMKTSIAIAALSLAVLAPGFANAAESTPRVDSRQAKQVERISAGLVKGRLTYAEAIDLLQGQAQIERAERKALRDGRISHRERAYIEKLQDRENRRIKKSIRDNDRYAYNDDWREDRRDDRYSNRERNW